MQQIHIDGRSFSLMIQSGQIEQRIADMAFQLSRDYEGKEPVFVAVLNGSFMFAAAVLKAYEGLCRISFVKMSSYLGTQSNGMPQTILGLEESLKDRHVIILEDIVDSGLTLEKLLSVLHDHEPRSIRVAALFSKPGSMKASLNIDYVGFKAEHEFLLGYGMDYNGYGRNLKHIYKLQSEKNIC